MRVATAQIGEYMFVEVVMTEGEIVPLWGSLQIVPSPAVSPMFHRAIHGCQPIEVVEG